MAKSIPMTFSALKKYITTENSRRDAVRFRFKTRRGAVVEYLIRGFYPPGKDYHQTEEIRVHSSQGGRWRIAGTHWERTVTPNMSAKSANKIFDTAIRKIISYVKKY
jgi:hypothetical protein